MREYDIKCARWRHRAAVVYAIVALIWGLVGIVWSAPQCPVIRYDGQSTARANAHATYDPSLEWSLSTNSAIAPVIGQDGSLYFGDSNRYFYSYSSSGTINWSYKCSSSIGGSAALGADGSVYIGLSGQLIALTNFGVSKWSTSYRFTASSTPTSILIDNSGTLYFGADDKYIYAVNTDGTSKWSYATGGSIRYGLSTSPDGSTVYATSSDGRIYAINSTTGALRWKTNAISGTYNCAVADDGTVYVGSTNGKLYAFNSNGTQKWAYQTQSKITCAPAISADGTIFFGSQDMNLYALDPTGHRKWYYRTGGPIYSAPTLDSEGKLIFGAWPGTLTALDQVDGAVKWTQELCAGTYNPPLIDAAGSIYALTTNGVISKFSGPVSPEPSSLTALAMFIAVSGGASLRRYRRRK